MKHGDYLSSYADPTEACWGPDGEVSWERNGRAIDLLVQNHYLKHEALPDWVVSARKRRKVVHLKSAIPLDKTIYLADQVEIREVARSLGLSVRKDTLVSTGVLIANLYQLVCLDITNCLSLSMDNTQWSKKDSGNPLGVTAHICKQVKALERNGWITRYRGFKSPTTGKGYNSVIVVKDKLNNLLLSYESLQLKISTNASIRRKSLIRNGKTGKRDSLPIDESSLPPHVIYTKNILDAYNEFINEQHIAIGSLTNKVFSDLIAFHCNYYGEDYEYQSRIIGGRYQNLPKKLRRGGLTINGEKTVEIDIVESHPTILYAIAGKPLGLDEIGKSYWLDGKEPSEHERREIKKAFSILLNSPSREKAISAIRHSQNSGDITTSFSPENLVRKLENRHEPVSHLFYKQNIGLRCMHYEGLIISSLLKLSIDREIVVLPLHDAILVSSKEGPLASILLSNSFHRCLDVMCVTNKKA